MDIQSLITSKRRREIMSLLAESSYTLKEISGILGVTPPVAIRQLRKLMEAGLVVKEGNEFRMSDKGYIVHIALKKFESIISTLERDSEFWEIHDLSGIPDEFKARIDEIGDYEIIRSGDNEILRHYQVFSSVYTKAKLVRVAAAVIFPTHPKMFVEIARKSDVEVIITSRILSLLKENYSEELEAYIASGGRILINDDLRLTLIVTESALCLGMYLRDGKYDTESGLISFSDSAVKWGMDLFEYFKRRSRSLNGAIRF